MFYNSLDLTGVLWEAEHKDGSVIHKGPQKYELIDRTQLETFSLTYRNNPILTVHPNERTLVHRLKTRMESYIVSGETKRMARVHIVALLAKPKAKRLLKDVKSNFIANCLLKFMR